MHAAWLQLGCLAAHVTQPCPRGHAPVPCPQVRREIQPIVSRNRYRRDGTSAYQLLAEQQRPAAAKAGKERLQVGGAGEVIFPSGAAVW